MAQTTALVKKIDIKIGNLTSQKDQVQKALENYVQKMISKAREAVETKKEDVNTLNEVSSGMDSVLDYLLHIGSQMEDSTPQVTEAVGLSSAPTLFATLPPEPSSITLLKRPYNTETDEMSKLQHRIEALESGLTACRNEMSQTTTQMTQAKDQLDTRYNRLEEKVQILTNQNQEIERKQASKFESMDKKIGDCQRQSQENDHRLANLKNHAQKLDEVTNKVEDIYTQLGRNVTERPISPMAVVRVGFTAFYPVNGGPVPKPGSRVTNFTTVSFNEGNHYNRSTGEFICPTDGVYVVSATLRQKQDGVVDVHIKRQAGNAAVPEIICQTKTDRANTSSSGVGVVRLQQGDLIFVHLYHKEGNPELSYYSSFSCFQIG